MSQGDVPDWGPLLRVVGEQVTGDFMWMFAVELTKGGLQAYKHIDTRRYTHLDPSGKAFAFQSPDLYRPVPRRQVLIEVFASLGGLAGVTDEQVRASSGAVCNTPPYV